MTAVNMMDKRDRRKKVQDGNNDDDYDDDSNNVVLEDSYDRSETVRISM